MKLLDRIAYSNGNPERTIAALRFLNEHLKRELIRRQGPGVPGLCLKDLSKYLYQPESQPEEIARPGHHPPELNP